MMANYLLDHVQKRTRGVWEDLRFPAQGINPPGAVSDPDRDTTTGFLLFAKAATEIIAGIAQMPHAWKHGSDIRPHIHIRSVADPSGTGATRWQLSYKWSSGFGTVPAAYTTETITVTLPDHSGGLIVNTIGSFTKVDGTGFIGSSLFEWKPARVGGDAADTYDDDAALVEFDFHYLANSSGSIEEFPS